MGRSGTAGWALAASVWAGLLGGTALSVPSPAYTVGFALAAFPAAYRTISVHRRGSRPAYMPGRLAVFVLASFVAVVTLGAIGRLLVPAGTAALLGQIAAFAVGLGAALYAAYGGGVDALWAAYT